MIADTKVHAQEQGRPTGFIYLWKKLGNKITGLFEPEEVEVTFKGDGNKMSYTYTKVEDNQAV